MPFTINENHLDALDVSILNLLLSNHDSKAIADILKKPLSTVQRRIRLLNLQDLIKRGAELNYAKLGFKKGLIHMYLQDGNTRATAKKLLDFNGILEVAIHIGNSDLVGTFVFSNSTEVLNLITNAKKLDGVERIVWSEEVEVIRKSTELNSPSPQPALKV